MTWNPRSNPHFSDWNRKGYHAGYSDGYLKYPYKSGQEDGDFTGYNIGFQDGCRDIAESEKRVWGPWCPWPMQMGEDGPIVELN